MGPSRLAHIFEGQRAADQPVAISGDQVFRFDQFARSVAAVAALAEATGKGRWLLASQDAWAFAVGFFGLLRAGCTVVIPPNHLPATQKRLLPEITGALTDQAPAASGLTGSDQDDSGSAWHQIPEPGEAWPQSEPLADSMIEFWTSGSSGEAKCISKRLSQLDAEVAILEETFGGHLNPGPVLGTVPHQHIYGCLFRILWPLASGRPFIIDQCVDPNQFRSVISRFQVAGLVSSPALLARLPSLLNLDPLAPVASAVFSSGGPMTASDASAWLKWAPTGVLEIFGSTETGGIAWRVQSEEPHTAHWKPFRDVRMAFEADGALRVESFRAGPTPVRMEDAGEPLADGRFRLLGRLDRIVKLEEKRVSLPELEAELQTHPWISQAAVTRLEGPRAVLGAVLVLVEDMPHLSPEEWRSLGWTFRQFLLTRFEAVAIPKCWRIVNELPYNESGKLTPQSLASLFAEPGN